MTGTQVAVPGIALSALKEERIDNPEDLFGFSKDNIDSVFGSLHRPPGKLVNNNVVTVAPHVILLKSRKCIAVAAKSTQYYAQFGRYITPTNMHWKTFTNI